MGVASPLQHFFSFVFLLGGAVSSIADYESWEALLRAGGDRTRGGSSGMQACGVQAQSSLIPRKPTSGVT